MSYVSDITTTESLQPYFVCRKATPDLVSGVHGFGLALALALPDRTDSSAYASVVKAWEKSFDQLQAARDHSNYNAEVPLPTESVVSEVSTLLADLYEMNPLLPAPDVVPDGDGGLDLESRNADRYISIHVESGSSRIFVRNAQGVSSSPLNTEVLEELFK